MAKRSLQVLFNYSDKTPNLVVGDKTKFLSSLAVPHIETSNMEPAAKFARGNPATPDELRHPMASKRLAPASPSGVEENVAVTPKTGRWTKREDDLLREAVSEHGSGSESWKRVSALSFLGTRSQAQCQQRWDKVLSVGLKKGQWTEEEDRIVRAEVAKGGGPLTVKWAEVAECLNGRLGKQVRERWQNHLDPALSKEPWEEAEDQLLISLQAVMGNKWSEIARAFQGRSENSVKNRWNSKQRKSLALERKLRTGSELGVLVPSFLEARMAAHASPPPSSAAYSSAAAACSAGAGGPPTPLSRGGGSPFVMSPRSSGGGAAAPSGGGAGGGGLSPDVLLIQAAKENAIKIDFQKALKAAHSPHITTNADLRRRHQPPLSQAAAARGAVGSHPPTKHPLSPGDSPADILRGLHRAEVPEALFLTPEDEVKQAGALLIDILEKKNEAS